MVQTDKKKVYDRAYADKRYDEFRELKDRISLELFGGECFLCHAREGYQNFHLHHWEYHPEDSSYARNSKALWTRKLRVEEAQAHPERFRLLCQPCHRLVTSMGSILVRRFKDARPGVTLEAYIALVLKEVSNRI